MVQERELIAVSALVAQVRKAEARSRGAHPAQTDCRITRTALDPWQEALEHRCSLGFDGRTLHRCRVATHGDFTSFVGAPLPAMSHLHIEHNWEHVLCVPKQSVSVSSVRAAMTSLMLRRLTTPADERKEARKS